MSGLKINYHKSEVVVFGVDKETESNIAKALNCTTGSLPMKYLGFPISDRKLKMEALGRWWWWWWGGGAAVGGGGGARAAVGLAGRAFFFVF
jgi:hypothetical protein